MRPAHRFLASVKPGRYLEAGNPTGLTGLFTHPAPRSTLIYLYSSTLDKLKAFPESSVYRQSAESLTRHRLKIVEGTKPTGWDEWAAKAKKQIAEHPEVFNTPEGDTPHENEKYVKSTHDGRTFVKTTLPPDEDENDLEWDGDTMPATLEGSRVEDERRLQGRMLEMRRPGSDEKTVEWTPEPPLEAGQIVEMENQIGAGLIEEVIQVAEGELKLVDIMLEAKVWEDLHEKTPPGQWDYFARDQHTPGTQAPTNK